MQAILAASKAQVPCWVQSPVCRYSYQANCMLLTAFSKQGVCGEKLMIHNNSQKLGRSMPSLLLLQTQQAWDSLHIYTPSGMSTAKLTLAAQTAIMKQLFRMQTFQRELSSKPMMPTHCLCKHVAQRHMCCAIMQATKEET